MATSNNIARCVSLAIALVSIVMVICTNNIVGVSSEHADTLARLCYHFYHASFIHALINAWCLLQLVFMFGADADDLIVSYIIASLVPDLCLYPTPTVGLSGICFALMGIVTPRLPRVWMFVGVCALYIALGLLMPGVNGLLHAYTFVIGIAWSLLIELCKKL